MHRAPDGVEETLRDSGSAWFSDPISLRAAERDFGGIARGRCYGLVEPTDARSSARLLEALGDRGLGCTLRGAGYSQSGQSVAVDGITLGTRRLDRISPYEAARGCITVGAGAPMRRVLAALAGHGVAPPVLPLNLDMSVGGLLSAGGLGPTSHRHGSVASNVLGVEVVTGDGKIVSCSPRADGELFRSVLSGLGQCGLMTQATLAVRPVPKRLRVVSFVYDDTSTWFEDQRVASEANEDVHIEGFCWASAKGLRSTPSGPSSITHWSFGLQIAFDEEDRDLTNLLGSLRARRRLDDHVAEFTPFVTRYQSRFAGMVRAGAWNGLHPWFEALVPFASGEEYLTRVLETLPAEAGDGHRVLLTPNIRRAGYDVLIGVLPVSIPEASLSLMLDAVDRLTDLALERNGRRYHSGWLGRAGAEYFRRTLANGYEEWLATRRRFDPKGIFRSALFP